MEAVPGDLQPDGPNELTGIACPDCYGVLQVRVVGARNHLEFTCRIGHTYSLVDLIQAKETDLERRVCAGILAAAEMDAFMRDVVRNHRVDADMASRLEARRAAARQLESTLRMGIENDRPVRFPQADAPDGG